MRKDSPQKKVTPLAGPTMDKIRRIMMLIYKHGHPQPFQ